MSKDTGNQKAGGGQKKNGEVWLIKSVLDEV